MGALSLFLCIRLVRPSICPSVRSLKYPLLTCTWVPWSTQPTVTVLRLVPRSVRLSDSFRWSEREAQGNCWQSFQRRTQQIHPNNKQKARWFQSKKNESFIKEDIFRMIDLLIIHFSNLGTKSSDNPLVYLWVLIQHHKWPICTCIIMKLSSWKCSPKKLQCSQEVQLHQTFYWWPSYPQYRWTHRKKQQYGKNLPTRIKTEPREPEWWQSNIPWPGRINQRCLHRS